MRRFSNEAEQLQRYSTIPRLMCVSLDYTFEATDSELRKMRSIEDMRMVRRQGAWHSRPYKRDMRKIEILGRSLGLTEEGLEYEASDKHRQALLEGLGLSPESKTVNSAGGMMMINGTVVKRWSRTKGTRALITAEVEFLRGHHRSKRGSRNAVDDGGLGTECTGPCMDGLQLLVAAGGSEIGKSEHEEGPRRATCGGHL